MVRMENMILRKKKDLGSRFSNMGTGHSSRASGRTVWFVKAKVAVVIAHA